MTSVPWFRGGFRETRRWVRSVRQKIRCLKRRGRSYGHLLAEDLPCAKDALARCIRQQRKGEESR